MKKVWSIVIASILALSLFAGCASEPAVSNESKPESAPVSEAGGAKPKLEGTVTFATQRTDQVDGPIKKLADDFMAANPGTTIVIEGIKDAAQTLAPRIASGEAPDILFNPGNILQKDFPKFFVPLDDLGYNDENAYVSKGDDGKVYLFTSAVSYNALSYNKTVFTKYNIEPPKTVDEFYAACQTLKDNGVVPFASNFKDSWVMQYFLVGYEPAFSGNGNWQDNLLKGEELLPADSARLAGLNILDTLKTKGYLEEDLTSTNWDQFKLDFAQGKVGMCYMGTWICDQLVENGMKSEDVGVVPFPGTKYLDVGGDYGYGISVDSKNPELAKAFLKYMWDDNRWATTTKSVTPLKDMPVEDPYVARLLESDYPSVINAPQPPEVTAVFGEMKFDFGTLCQEYLRATDKQSIIDKYNKAFADAKTELGL